MMFYQKQQISINLNKNEKNGEIESNFLNTPSGGLKLNHYLVQYDFDPMIQLGLVSKCG